MRRFTQAFDADRADLGDLAFAGPSAGGLQVDYDERHLGQVRVGQPPIRQSDGRAVGPAETPILGDEAGHHRTAEVGRGCAQGQESTGGVQVVHRLAGHEEEIVQLVGQVE